MSANFGSILNWVLRLEDRTLSGKIVNLGDGAGLTHFGLTQRACSQLAPPTFWTTMDNETALEAAKQVYYDLYWIPVHGTQIPDDVTAAELMSFAVNEGVKGAVRLLQSVLQISSDGDFGPETLQALLKAGATRGYPQLALQLREAQDAQYEAIVAANQSDSRFLKGWENRAGAIYPDLP